MCFIDHIMISNYDDLWWSLELSSISMRPCWDDLGIPAHHYRRRYHPRQYISLLPHGSHSAATDFAAWPTAKIDPPLAWANISKYRAINGYKDVLLTTHIKGFLILTKDAAYSIHAVTRGTVLSPTGPSSISPSWFFCHFWTIPSTVSKSPWVLMSSFRRSP